MSQSSERATGSIYDLGYQHYEGVRLGRSHAVAAIYFQGLKGAFGIGRRTSSKIIPIVLALIVLVPAAVQLGFVAFFPRAVTVTSPATYFAGVDIILALFCAAVAPELVGRDQRTRTLSLYFSRSLLRSDYAAAKFAALVTSLLIVMLAPQVLLFGGSALASSDSWAYLQDNWRQVAPIVGSSLAIGIFMGSISLVIAAQTPRRAYATGGVLAFFVILRAVGGILTGTLSGDYRRYSVLMDPFIILRGLTGWFFRSPAEGVIADVHLSGWFYLLDAAVIASVCLALLYRRYQKVEA
jgi:ABC-2 type transport system permease protein